MSAMILAQTPARGQRTTRQQVVHGPKLYGRSGQGAPSRARPQARFRGEADIGWHATSVGSVENDAERTVTTFRCLVTYAPGSAALRLAGFPSQAKSTV